MNAYCGGPLLLACAPVLLLILNDWGLSGPQRFVLLLAFIVFMGFMLILEQVRSR